MSDPSHSCSVVSLPDIELEGQIGCAQRRLIAIAPGFTESVAKVIAGKWRELGPDKVRIIVDLDPEICRLGFGDLAAVDLRQKTTAALRAQLYNQKGLRVGGVITDEATTIYSPVARLVEEGGKPGERKNAIRLDTPIANSVDAEELDLHPQAAEATDVKSSPKASNRTRPLNLTWPGRSESSIRSLNS